MMKKNTVTLKEIEENKIEDKSDVNKKNSLMNFTKKNILPFTYVCIVVCLLITLVGIVSALDYIKNLEGCEEIFCGSKSSMLNSFLNRLEMMGITAIASLVPYFYLPVLGLLGYMYYEVISFAHIINAYGYILGIIRYIIPFALNVINISVFTSVSIYLARAFTTKFRLNRNNSMNFNKFKLKVYEMTKNEKKFNELQRKEQEKMDEIEKNTKKIEWKNVAIIFAILVVIQFISVCIENLLI